MIFQLQPKPNPRRQLLVDPRKRHQQDREVTLLLKCLILLVKPAQLLVDHPQGHQLLHLQDQLPLLVHQKEQGHLLLLLHSLVEEGHRLQLRVLVLVVVPERLELQRLVLERLVLERLELHQGLLQLSQSHS